MYIATEEMKDAYITGLVNRHTRMELENLAYEYFWSCVCCDWTDKDWEEILFKESE
tara:strand:- start:603 stop:770 length:168 start_codon:yes stop_codon:yes gene_type:complete